MKQWYANELSKIAQVSVRTLHHYDRIDLLKPSLRLANDFRVYSETDLLKLQQIIALKVFGFTLTQIKTLLNDDADLIKQLTVQSSFLQQKAKSLLEASKTLEGVISTCKKDGSIAWKKL